MIFLKHAKTRGVVIILLGMSMFSVAAETVRADLSSSRARRALTRMAGFELTSGAVRIKTITDSGKTTANVTAELRTVFRFEQDDRGRWRVAEVRTGPDRWEEVTLISDALAAQVPIDECTESGPPLRGESAVDPTPKRVRCLLGYLLGVAVPSDAIRIQEIEPFALPFASQPSATVVAWIRVNARAVNDSKNGWHIAEIRTGDRDWVKLDQLVVSVNQEKQSRARADLQRIAKALENYRGDRGAYVVSDSHAVLIDHLSPKFLREVIRLDPWHQPYKYSGQRDRFTLVSTGPDGKSATPDDIAHSN
jgi:hypothetical protein